MIVGLEGVCNPEGSIPGGPNWTWGAFFDLLCTPATSANSILDVSATGAGSPMNPGVCYGGGSQLDQAACLAANQQAAADVAASDPGGKAAYDCSQSQNPFLCYLGVLDASGNLNVMNLLLVVGAIGLGVVVLNKI